MEHNPKTVTQKQLNVKSIGGVLLAQTPKMHAEHRNATVQNVCNDFYSHVEFYISTMAIEL